MMKSRDRLIGILLVGLVIVLVIASLTKSDRLVFTWMIVIGIGLMVGIGREWFAVNRIRRANRSVVRSYLHFALGSFPYLAGIALLAVFVYYSALLLLGRPLYYSHLTGPIRVLVYSLVAVFFGGFLLFIFMVRQSSNREK